MRFKLRFSLFLAVVLPLTAFAAVREPLASFVITNTSVEWQATGDRGLILSLQRPDGEVSVERFAAGRNPMLRVEELADGLYAYELRADDEGSSVQTGSFTVLNGAVVPRNLRESAPRKIATETFFSDDVSAAGGVCGGADCTNAEVYGVASIKMKENSTRLKFEDTSTLAGFATSDWQLSANDSASGGANKLYVEDLSAATVPFLIEGGTPNNALYVDSTGRIGLRTSTPGRDLTISAPVTTIIRMEQSTTPFQAWDVVANNNNFYVRDVNHEQNPFIILTSAPYNSLVIDASGRIGLGTATPSYQIHHSSGARLDAGVWVDASSRAVKQDIHALDRDSAFEALASLQAVTFAYKSNPSDRHVGFIAEDVPELVATPDRTGLAPMDVVAVLTKIVQEQQKTIADMRNRLEQLEGQ